VQCFEQQPDGPANLADKVMIKKGDICIMLMCICIYIGMLCSVMTCNNISVNIYISADGHRCRRGHAGGTALLLVLFIIQTN
jgi:hypothetical protein